MFHLVGHEKNVIYSKLAKNPFEDKLHKNITILRKNGINKRKEWKWEKMRKNIILL